MGIRSMHATAGLALAGWLLGGSQASALSVPFTEDFDTGVSGWRDAASNPLGFEPSGGPDGSGYATASFSYFGFSSPFGGGPVIFRAHDSDDASGDAFVGDWLAGGVKRVEAFVRHDAPVDLQFFLRVATSFNFPGAVLGGGSPVAPGAWTRIVFEIDPSDPACIGEGVTCAQALADVGNLQLGTDAPEVLVALDRPFTLDLDQVSLLAVPEPGPVGSLLLGLAGLGGIRRRGRSPARSEGVPA